MPKTYLLRGLDEDLWRTFKSAAALKGLSIKDAIIVAVKRFVQDEASNG